MSILNKTNSCSQLSVIGRITVPFKYISISTCFALNIFVALITPYHVSLNIYTKEFIIDVCKNV